MSLRDTFTAALKTAMLAKQTEDVGTIRLIMAAMKQKDIEARPGGVTDGISDEQILVMLQGMVKQRRESIALYEQGGRTDLVEKEKAEIAVIEKFLPAQMDASAVEAAITAALAETGASSVKDMGKVMAVLKAKFAGQMDFTTASTAVKAKLAG